MNSNIGLFLDAKPSDGGAYQFGITLVRALSDLKCTGFETLAYYTNKWWQPLLEKAQIRSVFTGESRWIRISRRRSNAFWPMRLWRRVGWRLNPVMKAMVASRCRLWFFPSQDTWTYLTPVPAVGVIFDLMHRYERRFPEVASPGTFYSREQHYKNMCRWSKALLVDSDIGRQQVVESYHVPPEKIHVLPFVPPGYLDHTSSTDLPQRLPEKYIFYPAQFWEHKNHLRLITAANAVRKRCPDLSLVFVGSSKNGYSKVLKYVHALGVEKNIHFLGYVPDSQMASLYRRARAMIMPTFFGPTNIPPLEAMTLGCPVAVSNIYGMPEQLGDAALFFNPEKVHEIADTLEALWKDDALCLRMAQRGLRRSSRWTQLHFNNTLQTVIQAIVSK